MWDPQNLIDTAHEKNREMAFYMKCLESYRYIYPEDFLCL